MCQCVLYFLCIAYHFNFKRLCLNHLTHNSVQVALILLHVASIEKKKNQEYYLPHTFL